MGDTTSGQDHDVSLGLSESLVIVFSRLGRLGFSYTTHENERETTSCLVERRHLHCLGIDICVKPDILCLEARGTPRQARQQHQRSRHGEIRYIAAVQRARFALFAALTGRLLQRQIF